MLMESVPVEVFHLHVQNSNSIALSVFRIALCILVSLSANFAMPLSFAHAQSVRSVGDCSPTLTYVRAAQNITFNCDQGRMELKRFARQMSDLRNNLDLNREQTEFLITALNNALPSFISQLNRIEENSNETIGISNKALDGITELLRRSITSSTPPDEIQFAIADARRKLLPGTALSECGCWGKPVLSEDEYGAIRRNPGCLSSLEENVACLMKEGSNVCKDGSYQMVGYAPWMRICK